MARLIAAILVLLSSWRARFVGDVSAARRVAILAWLSSRRARFVGDVSAARRVAILVWLSSRRARLVGVISAARRADVLARIILWLLGPFDRRWPGSLGNLGDPSRKGSSPREGSEPDYQPGDPFFGRLPQGLPQYFYNQGWKDADTKPTKEERQPTESTQVVNRTEMEESTSEVPMLGLDSASSKTTRHCHQNQLIRKTYSDEKRMEATH
ncbi:hypothetical protein ACOMHN_005864 [Nucella lapillus]